MNSSQDRQRSAQSRSQLAALAARLMAEDGISDIARAKRKAARQLGLAANAALPDDAAVEEALRTHQRLFHEAEQHARQQQLLAIAARLMTAMQRFNPYLTGAVLDGTAGRYTEIDIQLFADSAKDVEIFLLNEKFCFCHSTPRTERAEAVLTLVADDVTVNMVIYPRTEERVGFRTRDGRPRARARLATVRRLLDEASAVSR
ncbi:hypothetical protein [Accumulibacter sp.]|uniref:hypothetical protein n=1 Tax=Accumulibacter sp. TaxID=2053492 RepID=UPI0025D6BA78|nr:hypothetical protein [Accumulibacter sp.]MCM8611014.1 hypothetical protein [Accumulibacter sp.]MCM8634834.1 hypothetical protein [Accumulibacter sp.]MCM8638388.1 hypothetical protein [Accumulibacter sp.]